MGEDRVSFANLNGISRGRKVSGNNRIISIHMGFFCCWRLRINHVAFQHRRGKKTRLACCISSLNVDCYFGYWPFFYCLLIGTFSSVIGESNAAIVLAILVFLFLKSRT